MYKKRDVVGGFAIANYWSSTEYDNDYAWDQSFYDGNQGNYIKGASDSNIRAVRALTI